MYDVQQIVRFFLSMDDMTPKKLQKLLYYAYSWFLVFENEKVIDNPAPIRLFNERIEAWVHGPVVPKIYHQFKDRGANNIPKDESFVPDEAGFTAETLEILFQVWDVYGKYNGNQLESISHQEEPWKEARGDRSPIAICNNIINDETIFETYGSRL
ncbi:Panacea domain-containing protein [Exiguobacterium aurantiacum]|uniref:Uncharacterized phage-associated protein n=1 Tax=Exiguobacterium aurantiacum TaxID=33987 RepID=A0A377FTK0_9BACL|nr:type II toxin-antitoxin system antitoxin SocA domain-containing protein [Exiguobacterium aurantiacum]STO08078.1 Uncharacterized phage-associated protein [Exiguobacterium aurantiacum]